MKIRSCARKAKNEVNQVEDDSVMYEKSFIMISAGQCKIDNELFCIALKKT